MKDIIVVNFKTYKEGTAKNAIKLAEICKSVSEKTKKEIYAAVQLTDISQCSKIVKVFAQHIDFCEPDKNTGFITAYAVKNSNAIGTILNHSEHRISIDVLEKSINAAKKLGLITIVCADTPQWAEKVAKLNPDYIAIEPPELIGGDISVSTSRPEIITETIARVNSVKKIPILCGAGIKTKEDVQIAKKLGAKGILVASGIVLAKNPEKELTEMAEGLN
jgi:triosephosphate isomerase (TIM)